MSSLPTGQSDGPLLLNVADNQARCHCTHGGGKLTGLLSVIEKLIDRLSELSTG
jgi:hypothetical protein